MSVKEAFLYVDKLNMMYCNKLITREEVRAALKQVPLFGHVCIQETKKKNK